MHKYSKLSEHLTDLHIERIFILGRSYTAAKSCPWLRNITGGILLIPCATLDIIDQKAGPRYWNKHYEAFASPIIINSNAIRIDPGNHVEYDEV